MDSAHIRGFFEEDAVINSALDILNLRCPWDDIQVEMFKRQLNIHVSKCKRKDLD